MNYARNARYFKPAPPIGAIIVIAIIGVILLVCKVWLWGVVAIVLAIAIGYVMFSGIPSDAEIDAQRDLFMEPLKDQAIKKLGIDEEEAKIAPPLFLKGYCFGASVLGDKANQNVCDRKGSDGAWRSPECVLSAFFFTEHEIHYYSRTVSLISDAFKEYTEEFFYKDVVSIKTDEIERPWIDPKTGKESPTEKTRWTAFMIRNTGGETTECSCNSTQEADAAVNAMRSLVRQKKNA
jgi:hypothetical protein